MGRGPAASPRPSRAPAACVPSPAPGLSCSARAGEEEWVAKERLRKGRLREHEAGGTLQGGTAGFSAALLLLLGLPPPAGRRSRGGLRSAVAVTLAAAAAAAAAGRSLQPRSMSLGSAAAPAAAAAAAATAAPHRAPHGPASSFLPASAPSVHRAGGTPPRASCRAPSPRHLPAPDARGYLPVRCARERFSGS